MGQTRVDRYELTSIPFSLLGFQWLFGGPSPSIGLSPSTTVELVPIFPHVCPPALPPPVGKGWIDKRIPNCKVKMQIVSLDKWDSVTKSLGISITTENSVFSLC